MTSRPPSCCVVVAKLEQPSAIPLPASAEQVLPRAASPGFPVDRTTGLRARPTPLLVVHSPPYRTKVAVAEAVYVAVVRDAPDEVALDLVRTSGAFKQLLLLVGRGSSEVDWVDSGRDESLVHPGRIAWIAG